MADPRPDTSGTTRFPSLHDMAILVALRQGLYVRSSQGPAHELAETSSPSTSPAWRCWAGYPRASSTSMAGG